MPDPTTTAGWWEYYCGVQGALNAASKLPAVDRPHIWEALNEPDGFAVFNGNPGSTDESCAVTPVSDSSPALQRRRARTSDRDARDPPVRRPRARHGDRRGVHPPLPAYLAPYAPAARLSAERRSVSRRPGRSMTTATSPTPTVPRRPHTSRHFDAALGGRLGRRRTDLWVTEAGTLLTDRHGRRRLPRRRGSTRPAPSAPASTASRRASPTSAPGSSTSPRPAWPCRSRTCSGTSGRASPTGTRASSDGTGALRPAWCAFYGSGECTGSPSVATVPG